MVVFLSTSAALSCAVAMQRAVELDNQRTGRSLALRVGLSVGEATREGDDYFGDPVVVAARLCARAKGGQILAADVVRAMAGRRSPYELLPLGAIELKGMPEAIETLEIGWHPLSGVDAASHTVPMPSRLERAPSFGVVGRQIETAVLSDAYNRVATSAALEVVVITGEAGIGKTVLASQLARTAFEAGACVLLGRCDEDLGVPYGPFVEALGHYVAHAPEELLRSHVEEYGGELAKIVPALARRLDELPTAQSADPETERYLLYRAVTGLLEAESTARPVVLVLDDLQWADKPSLQLLRQLVSRAQSMRLLVVGTHRDSDLSVADPLTETLAALRREAGVSYLQLGGLDDAGVFAFMEAAAGHDLGRDGAGLARAVSRETDGNPFFVGELLLHLSEIGAIYQDSSGRWTAASDLETIALPESVRQVIGSRVARLGEAAVKVLPLAAVIGREFDLDLLTMVVERPDDEMLGVLDVAAVAGLVREVPDVPGRYSFTHALIQHTLYQDLGATRRARAHHRVAEAIEAIGGDDLEGRVGELAYQWSHATQPVDAAKVITYARQAAEGALAALAPDDAVRYFTQALEFVALRGDAEPLLGVDLLLGLGAAQRQAGIAASRQTYLEAANRARAIGAIDRLVAAALGNTRGFFSASGVIDTDKVAVLEATLEAIPREDSAERALLLATLCSEISFGSPFERRRALADEGRAMARRLGDAETILHVLIHIDDPLQVPSTLDERLADAAEARGLAEKLGDPEALYLTASSSQVNAMQAGDFELATTCLDTMRALSARLRRPTLVWMTAFKEAGAALMAGDAQRAEQIASSAFQIGRDSGQPDAFTIYGSQLMYARSQQGRLGELVSLIDQAVTENPGIPAFRPVLASAHLEAGNDATARVMLDGAAADGFAWVPLDFAWMMAISTYAQVAVELRAGGPAETLYDLLVPYGHQVPFIGTLGFSPASLSLVVWPRCSAGTTRRRHT